MDGLGFRIKTAADEIGGLDKLSEVVPEMSRRALSNYVSEKNEPRASLIREIALATGVSPLWLLTGDGDPKIQGGDNLTRSTGQMIRLPVYGDVQAAAGRSSIPPSEIAEGVMSFDRRFLRDQGAAPEHCSVIWAKGDSMTPTIPDGSALVVDRSQTAISNGCIMVIGVGDDLLVKRVRRRLDGLVELLSDNASYPPETLGPDSLGQLRVVGRVVYFCRTP